MNLGLVGKYIFHKQKVVMKDGKPLLDENGNQILVGEREKVAEFENLITNNGLDLIGKQARCPYMIVSSDNTTPQFTDTTISVLGASNVNSTGDGTVSKNVTTPPYWVSIQKVNRFNAGIGTGNIAKIAISNNASGTDLFSIALVKDSNGKPTTITKLADEILDVVYELKTYLNTSDTTSTITISGNTHTVISRLYKINAMSGAWVDNILYFSNISVTFDKLRPITTPISGVNIGYSTQTYVPGSYQFSISPNTINIGDANWAEGINNVLIYNALTIPYQFGISPPIMKTSTQTLKLPPITISWARYEGAL